MENRKIPIVMICDSNFVMQTSVALTSLYSTKQDLTQYDVYILLADDNREAKNKLENLSCKEFSVSVIMVSLKRYENIKQLAHVPVASCLKFDISDLIPQYDKLLYLDSDIIVREDLRKLYEINLGENYVAGVPHSLGILTGERKLNGGVLLFNAAKIRKEKLREVFLETRQSLGERKSMDQETFYIVFGDKKVLLSPRYNVMRDKVEYEKKYYSLSSYNAFFHTDYKSRKEIVRTAAIIHFTGNIKPWKYNFAVGGEEWLQYYEQLFGDIAALKLKGRLQFCKEQICINGMKSIYWLIKDKVLGILGETFYLFIDKSYEKWN